MTTTTEHYATCDLATCDCTIPCDCIIGCDCERCDFCEDFFAYGETTVIERNHYRIGDRICTTCADSIERG